MINETIEIYKFFKITYFDFLDDVKSEHPAGTLDSILESTKKTHRDYLDFYSLYGDKLPINIKIYSKKNPINDTKEYYNIDNNFYIGHLLFESLILLEDKGEFLEKLINIRAAKYQPYFEKIKNLVNSLKDTNEKEKYKREALQLILTKYIITYEHFLQQYEEKKDDNFTSFKMTFNDNSGTSKEDYIKFLLSNNKPFKAFVKKKLEAFIPNKARYKHTYITGQSGSGKSELLKGLIFSVIRTQKLNMDKNKGENFILLDPHGDLSDDIFNLAVKYAPYNENNPFSVITQGLLGLNPKMGKVILLDPFADYEKTPVINPFTFKGNEQQRESYAEELLGVFGEILGADFTLNAQAILAPCIATVLKIKRGSLYDLQRFMDDDNNQDLVKKGKITKNTAHKNFFENAFYSSNLNATKRAIFLKIQILLNNKSFSNLTTGKSTIDLEEIMNNGQNLIIKLNKSEMRETLTPFGRFLIAKIQSVALKRKDIPKHLRPKTHFFIDEFQNFLSPTTEEILTESRKYRLFLTLAHQVISQLEESKMKDIVLSNTNIKIVGQNGYKTHSVLARELGIKREALEKLQVGEFFVRIGKNPAFKIKHQLLDNEFFKTTELTREYKKNLLLKYYVKPTIYKAPDLKTDAKKHYVNEVIKDKKVSSKNKDYEKNLTDKKPDKKDNLRTIGKPKFNDF